MLIEIEIDETNLIPVPEQVLILSNFNYKKGEMSVAVQAPGFIPAHESVLSPIRILFGTSHGEITKRRTADAKAVKKAIMDKNNKVAKIAKDTKKVKKDIKAS